MCKYAKLVQQVFINATFASSPVPKSTGDNFDFNQSGLIANSLTTMTNRYITQPPPGIPSQKPAISPKTHEITRANRDFNFQKALITAFLVPYANRADNFTCNRPEKHSRRTLSMKPGTCFNYSHFAIIKFNKNALRFDKWDGMCTQKRCNDMDLAISRG